MEKNHIIAGDYNINILSNEPKPEELSNECLSHGYLPLFNSITIPNENDGTCIANFYAKSPIDLKAIKHSQVFADHYPLFCDFNIIKPSTNRIDYFHKLNINCYRRKLWNYINNKLGKNCKTECPVKKIKFNDNTIEDADIIANHFNDFFSNIGLELANKIRSSNPAGSNYHSISNRNSRSVYLWPVTSTELQTVISDMKNKNGGSDNIHSRVLKIISHIISPVLTEIFNDCIEMDIWPSSLKQDDVVPIFKSGDDTLATNYRPTSLISNIAKGFIKGSGTTEALEKILNSIYENIDNDNAIIATFMDLSKAFDTVNHTILLEKLENEGIRGVAFDLLKQYLSNRTQRVKIGSATSLSRKIEIGVPQVTILGLLLFLVYINDIFDVCEDTYAFADDTIVLDYQATWEQAQRSMSVKLKALNDWFVKNELTLNITKTEHVTFGWYANSVPQNTEIIVGGRQVGRTNVTKYLGIFMDFNLKWDYHIHYPM
uniref:Reverse transcriptase domain-containing protein n=1 Tax=Trichogramma kaykai TaxID=54128 RepID=A0ABD2VZ34_9HYME